MGVPRKIVGFILRIYCYIALLMFFSGVIGGAWLAMNGYDQKLLSAFF
jgi:hypothetical protein